MAVENTHSNDSYEETANYTINQIRYDKISNEKRQSLLRLVKEQGQSIKEAAGLLQIKYSTVRTIISNYEKTHIITLQLKGGSIKTVRTRIICDKIDEIVSFNPQFTLKEIKSKLLELSEGILVISLSSINRCLQDLKIKLKLCHRELDRVNALDKIQLRKEYALWFNNHFQNDFSRAIFIDESSFNLHLKRSYARSRQGTRAIVVAPTVRGRSISLIASMGINGMGYCKVISNSTVNGDIFAEYITELCRYLRDELHMQDACLILDNARIHRHADIQRITTEFGYEFKFLSPYSYMLNPIECAFSKIKNRLSSKLRSGAQGMLAEVESISPNDSAGYFRHILRNITNCAAELPYTHN
ncbi:hypothetical protein ENBRE01_1459 [Enteropsectra breve]|nr:hypothetical protein ENBRE01_1459 [Enteropsectra breve]